MTELRHEVMLPGCSRDWFERFVAEVHDEIEAGQQARRLADGLSVTITTWVRARETGITLLSRADGVLVSTAVKLRSADQPRTIEIHGKYRNPAARSRFVRRADWRADVSLTRWWNCVTAGATAVPATVVVTHPLVRARVALVPRLAGDVSGAGPQWAVTVVTVLRGRSWARPLAAALLPLLRRMLQAQYRDMLDEMAGEASAAATWTERAPHEAARSAVAVLYRP